MKFLSSSDYKSSELIQFSAVTLLLLIINLIIKNNSIFSNAMFQDDLIGLPNAIEGNLISTSSQVYLHISKFIGNVIIIKLLHVFLLSMSGALTFLVFKRYFHNSLILLIAVLLSFVGISSLETANHVMGSLMLWSYSVFILFCLFITNYQDHKNKLLISLLSFLFGLTYLIFKSVYAVLLIFPIIFLLYSNNKMKINYFNFIYYLAFILPFVFSLINKYFENKNLHHYQTAGFVDFRFGLIISNIFEYFHKLTSYILNIFYADTIGFAYLQYLFICIIVLVFIFILYKGLLKIDFCNRNFIILLTFICFFLATLAPILPLDRSLADRYLFLPSIFLWLLVFYILDLILLLPKVSNFRIYLIISIVAFLFVNLGSAVNLQRLYYNDSASAQQKIESFIANEQKYWPENAQIITVLNNMPSKFTEGYNHWSTGFIQYISKRKDLTGVIGADYMMIDDPFVEKYRDHGEEYWTTQMRNDGSSYRRRKTMVGLEINRPTYAYSLNLDDEKVIKYNYICVKYKTNEVLYKIDETGITVVDNSCRFKRDSTLFYTILDDVYTEIPEIGPSDSFLQFDNNSFIEKNISVPTDASEIIYEIVLQSENDSECFAKVFAHNNTCPPMPLLAYPLAIYQERPTRYAFQIKLLINNEIVDRWVKFNFQNGQWYKLRFVFDKRRKSVSVFINNTLYEYITDAEVDLSKTAQIKLGLGYNQRYWNGKISYFRIYDNKDATYININTKDESLKLIK